MAMSNDRGCAFSPFVPEGHIEPTLVIHGTMPSNAHVILVAAAVKEEADSSYSVRHSSADATVEEDTFDFEETWVGRDVMAVASSYWMVLIDSSHLPHCMVVVVVVVVDDEDNLATVAGVAFVAVKEDMPAVRPTYCWPPTLVWQMRPCQPNREYRSNLVLATCGLERIVKKIDSSCLEVAATMKMVAVVAPTSFRSVVTDTYRWYWVVTQPEVAWCWASNKRMVVRRTVVVDDVAAAACMSMAAVGVVGEGIAEFAEVDLDN